MKKTYYAIRLAGTDTFYAGFQDCREIFKPSHYYLYDQEVADKAQKNFVSAGFSEVVVSPNQTGWRDS